MATLLQALGVILLLIVGYIAFRVLTLLVKAALIIYGVKKLVSQVASAPTPPPEISITQVSGARWDDERAAGLASALPALGFHEVGVFDLDLMGGTRLQSWVRPDQGLYAIIYQSPQAGTWADLVTKYQDGTSLTYSNSPHGGRLKQRPGAENVYFPGVGTEQLYRKMLDERPEGPTRQLSASQFKGDFERAYAEETRWRQSPEGFDPSKVGPAAALAGLIGGKFTEDQKQQVRHAMLRTMYEAVAVRLRRKYREESGLSEEAWSSLGPRLVFVWDSMNLDSLHALLTEWDGLPEKGRLNNFLGDDHFEVPGSDRARRAFAGLNAEVPEGKRLRKLGEVESDLGGSEPFRADIYKRPEVVVVSSALPPDPK